MYFFLDDIRSPPSPDWIIVRRAEDLWTTILQIGLENISGISFDNDLGTGQWEGYQLLDKIEELIATTNPPKIPDMWVHSGNTVATKRMLTVIDRIHQRTLF